jgi:uncharacterized protein YutE (UPF0331/DUF86 family)
MLDKELVQRKVALIQDDLRHLIQYEDLTIEKISEDFVTQAVVERVLERLIGRAIDINQHIIAEKAGTLQNVTTYGDTFMRLVDLGVYPRAFGEQIAKSAGIRNILVHEYNTIRPELLQKSIGDAIKEFNHYTKDVLSFKERTREE